MCHRRVTLPCSVQIDAACSVWLLSAAYRNRAMRHALHGMGKKSNMLYQKRFIENMGISHSVLWACDHHWLHYDIRFPGGTYARSMRLATVVSFTTYAVSRTDRSALLPDTIGIHAPFSFISGRVGVLPHSCRCTSCFVPKCQISNWRSVRERQPRLSRV